MPHGKCLGPEFSRAQCEAECAQDPQCYAFDIPMTQRPEGKPGDGCCLHGAGNTGNKEYGRDCFVMSGVCLKPCLVLNIPDVKILQNSAVTQVKV